MKTPLVYRDAASGELAGWTAGHTVDISANGVLIDADPVPVAGQTLEVAIDWPGPDRDRPRVRLLMTALVVRVDGARAGLRIVQRDFHEVRAAVL